MSESLTFKARVLNLPQYIINGTKAVAQDSKSTAVKLVVDLKNDFLEIVEEVKVEFFRPKERAFLASLISVKDRVLSFIHIPFLPAFHSPGWLLRYIIGPHDRDWVTLS